VGRSLRGVVGAGSVDLALRATATLEGETCELEIAQLIVDRQTNREIAEGLFLSPKTVETHIRNIFAKLGADSRVEVARIVERAAR
jgi:DNA-binding CsgD family transcriptional regulator